MAMWQRFSPSSNQERDREKGTGERMLLLVDNLPSFYSIISAHSIG